jgi:hypothetical protein
MSLTLRVGCGGVMGSNFRQKALDLFRLARETTKYERKLNLLNLAWACLSMANYEERVQQLGVETEGLTDVTSDGRFDIARLYRLPHSEKTISRPCA